MIVGIVFPLDVLKFALNGKPQLQCCEVLNCFLSDVEVIFYRCRHQQIKLRDNFVKNSAFLAIKLLLQMRVSTLSSRMEQSDLDGIW